MAENNKKMPSFHLRVFFWISPYNYQHIPSGICKPDKQVFCICIVFCCFPTLFPYTHGMNTKNLYAFTLGREWKVSLAELMAIFGTESYQSHSETVAIFQIVGYSTEQLQRKFLTIGGSIRIIEILGDSSVSTFPTDVIEFMRQSK